MSRRVRKNCKNNKGFTLVELLVTIAVATIVVGGAVGFMMTGYNQYHSQNSNINLQYEAQLAMNQVEDLILNATNGIAYDEDSATLTLYNQVQSEAADGTTTTQNIVTTVVWDSENKQLNLSKYNYGSLADGSTGRDPISVNQLMADYVNDFSINLTDLLEKKLVGIAMGFSLNDKSYDTDNNVRLRNNIGLATDATAFTNERIALEAVATDIVVTPTSMTVARGSTAANGFSAYVVGTNFPLQDVTWEISDQTPPSDPDHTYVNPTTGQMTIGANETRTDFTLVVSSVTPSSLDSDAKITKTVTVYNKYATGLNIDNITLTGDKTAQIKVSVEGYKFENTDVAAYQGINLSFSVKDENNSSSAIYANAISMDGWTLVKNTDQQITYTTTITLNDEQYMDQDITVTASKAGLDSGTGTVKFPSVQIEDARIVLYEEDGNEVKKTSADAYELGRGGTYTVGVEVKYKDGTTEVIQPGNEKWSYINWTVSQYFTYGDGKLIVPDDLASNAECSLNSALETSSSVKGLDGLKAAVYIPKVELKIVESGNKNTVFPLLASKQYNLTFQVTGVSGSLAQSYSVEWSSRNNNYWSDNYNDNDSLSSKSASGMTASFQYKLGRNTTSSTMTLKFDLMKNNTPTGISAGLKVRFGSNNVYMKYNYGYLYTYIEGDMFFLPAGSEVDYFYLLDGTEYAEPTYITVETAQSLIGGTDYYYITYNGSRYKWGYYDRYPGWYQQ